MHLAFNAIIPYSHTTTSKFIPSFQTFLHLLTFSTTCRMRSTTICLKSTLLDFVHKFNYLRPIYAQLVTNSLPHNKAVVIKHAEFFSKTSSVDINFDGRDFLKHIDSFPINTLISRYASSYDRPQEAVFLYRWVVKNGFLPDMYTFPAILKSSAKFLGIGECKQFHGVIVKMGFQFDIYVQNSLLHLYSVCGYRNCATKVFDDILLRDVVSWTGIISGFVRSGLFEEAISFFLKMDVKPNTQTVVSVLVACGRQGYLEIGKGIHGLSLKQAFEIGLEVSNALIDMYVKCESLIEAKQVFHELTLKDIVSWTSIISGLVQCKHPKESLELFSEMQALGVKPDGVLLTSVLSACASTGALDQGIWVHEYIDRKGIKWDQHIGTAMLDMYAKCGCIDMALHIFGQMSSRNVFTWNALLGGLAMHGHGHQVLKHFKEMVRVGIKPNEVTFLAIMTACCHSGLVVEGRTCFHAMTSPPYSLSPRLEHYGSMVDLLCRAGLVNEAFVVIKAMPMPPDVLIWGAILSACNDNENVVIPEDILDHLLKLESHDSGVYVLLSNLYASNKRWTDVTKVRRLMKANGIKKAPGSSVIELDGEVHEFLVGDSNHLQNEEIRRLLQILTNQVYIDTHRL